MQSKIAWLLVLTACVSVGCRKPQTVEPPKVETLFRLHFVGANRLGSDTNAAHWMTIAAWPATRELEEQVLYKLANAPQQFLQNRRFGRTNEYTDLIKSLLRDLIREESFVEMRRVSNQTPEFVLAVRLSDDRALAWKTNMATILSSWSTLKPSDIRSRNLEGWELRKHHAPNLIRFARTGQWIVLGGGQDQTPMLLEVVEQIRTEGQPRFPGTQAWLEAFVDWPRLQPLLQTNSPVCLPKMHLTLTGKDDNLRTKMDMVFPKPITWSHEPWKIPTNTIREPLVSFTAGQGIARFLGRWKELQDLQVEPLPNQFCSWAMGNLPFQTFLAVPSRDTTNLLQHLQTRLAERFNLKLKEHLLGEIRLSTNDSRVFWWGLPFVVPFIEPVVETNGEFMLAGIFPNAPDAAPLPPELLAQVSGRTNLIYYDWEITQERLAQWRHLSQLFLLISGRPQLDGSAKISKWLDAVAPSLGNTVTEITLTGLSQLTLVRKSPIGFTGFELVALANWLESPGFPLCGYSLSRRPDSERAVSARAPSDAETGRQR